MRRLTSIDFLRGLAVWFMTVAHALMVNLKINIPTNPLELPTGFLILGVIFVNFMHWRGFFILISGVANFYQMFNAVENGKSRFEILKKQFFTGILLIVFGKMLITFFYFYGIIDNWTRSQGWNWDNLSMFFYFDTVESLGFMMILSGCIFFFLSLIKSKKTLAIMSIFSLFIISVLIFVFSPYVQDFAGQIAGVAIASDSELFRSFGYKFDKGFWEKFIRIFLNAIGGREAPLFPMWGIFLIGGALAAVLQYPNPKKWILRLFYIPCLCMILWGAYEFVFIFRFENLTPFFHVFPRWYTFISVGPQLIVIIIFLIQIEFNPKINSKLWLNWTKYFRRFGIFAFTVYWFQLLEAGPRLLFGVLFGIETAARSQLSVGWSLIITITTVLIWSGLLYVSDKRLSGIGTWEWFLLVLRNPQRWKKNANKGLDMDGVLHNVEMIHFADNKPQKSHSTDQK
ncbi:MAG: hypothetical protein JW776_15540 [Candidatus Lokiarchaeota archaeon]|nr:hypothetical protein [Candidatus Lokiarchaeota archaeon]